MTRRFSTALKRQMVARLTGVNAVSGAQLSRETGIRQQNLSRWLNEARKAPRQPSFWRFEKRSIAKQKTPDLVKTIVQADDLGQSEPGRHVKASANPSEARLPAAPEPSRAPREQKPVAKAPDDDVALDARADFRYGDHEAEYT